jgi:Na+-driven multidrug efflux pump
MLHVVSRAPVWRAGLDWWTFEVIVMLSGLLPNPEQTMSMMGITFNVHALCFFAAHGLSGAASTRIGNDLGEHLLLASLALFMDIQS